MTDKIIEEIKNNPVFNSYNKEYYCGESKIEKIPFHNPVQKIIKLYTKLDKWIINPDNFPKENNKKIQIILRNYVSYHQIIGCIDDDLIFEKNYIMANLLFYKNEIGNFFYNNHNDLIFILIISGNIKNKEFIVKNIGDLDIYTKNDLKQNEFDYYNNYIKYERQLKFTFLNE